MSAPRTAFDYQKCERDSRSCFNPVDSFAVERLATSISKYGYIADFPVVVAQHEVTGQWLVLDGWHRVLACRKTKTEPTFVEFRNLACQDPAVFHLTAHHYRKDILKMSQALSLLYLLDLDEHTRTDTETKKILREVNLSDAVIHKALHLKSRVSNRLIAQHLANPRVTTIGVLEDAAL